MVPVASLRARVLPTSGGATAAVGSRHVRPKLFALLAATLAGLLTWLACGSGSNSGNTPVPPQHRVVLSWESSASVGVVGYFVYRASTSGGPYTRITGQPVDDTTYTDRLVVADGTYYYVVTSLSDNGMESVYSNEASATIPSP